jgi:hypothetical protein
MNSSFVSPVNLPTSARLLCQAHKECNFHDKEVATSQSECADFVPGSTMERGVEPCEGAPYYVCMANKVSSAPLFGSATREEVAAVEKHMQDFTAKVVKDAGRARKLLEDIGAVAPDAGDAPAAG